MNIKGKTSTTIIAVALITVMIISIGPFASAKKGNIHLDAAISTLQSGDTKAALMHINEADKTLSGGAKMHLDAAISASQSGDTNGALMHLQQSETNLIQSHKSKSKSN